MVHLYASYRVRDFYLVLALPCNVLCAAATTVITLIPRLPYQRKPVSTQQLHPPGTPLRGGATVSILIERCSFSPDSSVSTIQSINTVDPDQPSAIINCPDVHKLDGTREASVGSEAPRLSSGSPRDIHD